VVKFKRPFGKKGEDESLDLNIDTDVIRGELKNYASKIKLPFGKKEAETESMDEDAAFDESGDPTTEEMERLMEQLKAKKETVEENKEIQVDSEFPKINLTQKAPDKIETTKEVVENTPQQEIYRDAAKISADPSLKKEYQDLSTEVAVDIEKLEKVHAELKKVITAKDSVSSELGQLKDEVKNTKSELNKGKSDLEYTRSELHSLKSEIKTDKAEKESISLEFQKLKAEETESFALITFFNSA